MDLTPRPSERITISMRKWALLATLTWLWWIVLAGTLVVQESAFKTLLTFAVLVPGGIGLLAWWLINMEFHIIEI